MDKFVITQDGSISAEQAALGELYHNRQGAYTEALVNYARPAIALILEQDIEEIVLLDVCFGLGYNTLVLLEQLYLLDRPFCLTVTAIDNDPDLVNEALPLVLAQAHFDLLKKAMPEAITAQTFTQANWQTSSVGKLTIKARLIAKDLRQTLQNELTGEQVGLVFHDAFAPQKVPRLWTSEVFSAYSKMLQLAPGALLTYSCSGAVRGALIENGFTLYKTAKLGYKSGGTLATLKPLHPALFDAQRQSTIAHLSPEEQSQLTKSSRVPYRDSHGNDSDTMRLSREREQEQLRQQQKMNLDYARSEQIFKVD